MLSAFALLPVCTDLWNTRRFNNKNQEEFVTAYVPFDKDFGTFCINMQIEPSIALALYL